MPFKKGQSGNPTGRPKLQHDIVTLAKTSAPEIMMRLIDLAMGNIEGVDYGTQVKAATAVLDRGYGKPSQAMELTGKDGQALFPTINITGLPQYPLSPETSDSIPKPLN